MKLHIKNILMAILLSLLAVNQAYTQEEEIYGSWIISSEYTLGNYGYKNYQINFGENSILNSNDPDELSFEDDQNRWKFVFSAGAYRCDNNIATYLTGKYYYIGSSQESWMTGDYDDEIEPSVQIIRTPYGESDYAVFYISKNKDGSHHDPHLFYNEITTSNGETEISQQIWFDFEDEPNIGHSSTAFTMSNIDENGDRYMYIVNAAFNNNPNYFGLQSYKINSTGIQSDESLLLPISTEQTISVSEYHGYNIELKDKYNTNEDPILAWIISPVGEDINSKIYIYNDDVTDDHYVLDFSDGVNNGLPETGRIAGIEFSPFPDEQDFMYVSSEYLGIIKINWQTGELIEQYTTGEDKDFSHSYVQTAPDGNVYVVSDDGTTFGMISKEENHLFYGEAFRYPYYVNQNNVTTEFRLSHINYKQDENNEDAIKYYTLPENDFRKVEAKTITTDNLCDIESGSASIFVYNGVPEYTLEYVKDENGEPVTNLFTFNPETNSYDAVNIDIGTYEYKISDESECEHEFTGTFIIGEGSIYDFEQDLLEIDENASTEIYGLDDMIWDANDNDPENGFIIDNTIMFKHGFVLKDNQTLTINNLRLEFDEDYLAKVIIEPGSKLILNNCTLTNYHCWDPDAKWAGIEVWGVESLPQTGNSQGELVLNNTTIEHAHEAVQLWNPNSENPEDGNMSGGIITAINSTFKNNRRAVSFMLYKNEPFGLERNYDAAFNHCDFINDEDYINDNPFYVFVSMWGVRGVQFKACDFINSSEFPERKAIYSLNAGYKLKGYCNGNTGPNGCVGDWIPNTFANFEKAIESANTPDPEVIPYSINIWDSEFENNQWGVYMTSVNRAATMLYNKFFIGNSGIDNFEKTTCGYFSTRGIQMNESFGFNIEENEFDKMPGNIDNDIVGVLVKDCPSEIDDIYKNQFNNLTAANQAEGNNREVIDDDATGVSYLCNENASNIHDFYITADESRIRGKVGTKSLASGNKLSNTSLIFRNDYTQNVNYYYWNVDGEILPDISEFDYVKPIEADYPNECLSNFGNGGGIGIDPKVILTAEEKQETEQEFYESYQDYNAVNSLLEQLEDGGSTEATSLSIASAQPGDTWELRSNLLGMSPYLSKEVLMEAADRTDVLPESILFEILSANPDELRKAELMDYLENKDQPLPEYMIAILRQMSNGTSAKTALLNQKAQYFKVKTKAAQKMIRSIKNEEELDIIALRNWLSNLESLEADKQVVATYLYEEDYTNAFALLDLIPDLYNLEGDHLDQFNDYVDLLNLQIGLKQQNRNIFMLTEPEKSQLLDLAENSTGDARNGARSILSFVYGNQYCDCITPIEGGNKSNYSSYVYSDEDMAKALGFSMNVKPNPAHVYASIDYALPIGVEQAELHLINVEGKIVWTQTVTGAQGQITLDSRGFKPGAYLFRLISKDYSIFEPIIIE